LNNKGRSRSYVRKARRRVGRADGLFRRPAEVVRTLLSPLIRLSGGGAPGEASPAGDDRLADDRARIIVPRHERDRPAGSELDIELREVRYGARSRTPYLRVVPKQREFTRISDRYIAATPVSSRPRGRIERVVQAIKGIVLGSPFATSRLLHERLSKLKALAILGSDPLSSSAYATEAALLILILGGSAGLDYILPIGGVIALLLIVVSISYSQTIRAYPGGGGSYTVSHENLGRVAGLAAAGALMVDYILLVSVSAAAGVAAITSAVPGLLDYKVGLAGAVIALFTLGNLRGLRESGTLFAAPTYLFIGTMGLMVIIGTGKVIAGDAPGSITEAGEPQAPLIGTQGITLWLIMRAFSAGASAITGVETIANGTPMFKPRESDNARATMMIMAAIAVFLFLGTTFLASRFGIVPESDETLVSTLGREVFGKKVIYYLYQVGTAAILFLAANSAFNAFPLLAAILARDRYLPRQFSFRGDKLAYSNGILVLGAVAVLLLVVFNANVNNLIPLYALGVFIAVTLSQTGMVKRWWQQREPGWRPSLAMNAVGAVATGIVALIIAATKFVDGAWISVVMVVALVVVFAAIRRHYDWFQRKIAVDETVLPSGAPRAMPLDQGAQREHVIVPVDGINKISLGAIAMAREISTNITAVHVTDDKEAAQEFAARWERAIPDVPLLIIESPYRAFVAPMLSYLERLDQQEEQRITVILPTFVPRHWWERILHNRDALRLRPFLKDRPGLRVVDFPFRLYEGD
jgi:amino acid transporter